MPSVVFDPVYLHVASDPATYIALVLDGEQVSLSKAGEVRTMANGRRRAVLRAGQTQPFSCTTDFVDPADRQTLEGWVAAGTLLMLREPRGRVAWGHIFGLDETEKPANDEALVTWTFEPVTYVEAV